MMSGQLNLAHSGQTEFPAQLVQSAASEDPVTVVNLEGNAITVIPPTVASLRACLRVLNLKTNQLRELPPEIGALVNLEELDVCSLTHPCKPLGPYDPPLPTQP